MKPRIVIAILVLLALILATAGVVLSMSSANYTVSWDSMQGAGAGGTVSTSAGYRIEGSFGGAVLVTDSSTGFKSCSGFECVQALFNEFLPLIFK